MGGLDVQAEDIIDIIEGYKGKGYAISSQEELGKCLILFWILYQLSPHVTFTFYLFMVLRLSPPSSRAKMYYLSARNFFFFRA